MNDREYLIQQLAHQILHAKYDSTGAPLGKPTPGVEQVATGDIRLDLEIKGMVTNMRRQIWVDQGAWTAKIVAEIERQATEIDVAAIIEKRVREELNRTLRDLESMVAKEISSYIADAVYGRVEYLKSTVREMAEKLVDGIRKAAEQP